jgi:hypothetical protein
MRDPIVWVLVLLVAWLGTTLLMNGLHGGHAILTALGIACCAVAVALYFVLLLSDGEGGKGS